MFKRKNKDIILKQDISGYLVFPYPLKGDVVVLGRKAVVPENTCLVIATKGKVLDILPSGSHILTPAVLPRANKKFKLNKIDKYGQMPEGFQGYAYFVNLDYVQNFAFGTYKKLRYKNELDGKFSVGLEFVLNLEIEDTELLIKNLLRQLAYLRPNEAEDIVATWVSEFVTDTLQKYAFRRSEFQKPRVFEMTEVVGAKIQPLLKNVGINVLGIGLLEVDISGSKKQPKNPLLTNIPVLAPALDEMAGDGQVNDAMDEDWKNCDEFESEGGAEGYTDSIQQNSTNFEEEDENIWLSNAQEESIHTMEDFDTMTNYDDDNFNESESWQDLPEPDYETLENERAKKEEAMALEKNKQTTWRGWESFFKE